MRRRPKPRTLRIGSISTGTLRPEDILPELFYAGQQIRMSSGARQTLRKLEREFDARSEPESLSDIMDEALSVLEDYTPDYCYLGSHPGDGADLGVWPSEELLSGTDDAGDVYRSDRLPGDARPAALRRDDDYNDEPYWLHVNDHGNATLYRRAGRRWINVWSVV